MIMKASIHYLISIYSIIIFHFHQQTLELVLKSIHCMELGQLL